MANRPILFSTPMVLALLSGRKTQTRRVLNPQPVENAGMNCRRLSFFSHRGVEIGNASPDLLSDGTCPAAIFTTYTIGDRLYVREQHYRLGHWERLPGVFTNSGWEKWAFVPDNDEICFYAPDTFSKSRNRDAPETVAWHKQSGMFMPRRASRLTLTVTDVRVERLQECSEADAIAEGVECDTDGWRDYLMPETQCCLTALDSYATLWDRINGPGAWQANPWICAISFSIEKRNIDD